MPMPSTLRIPWIHWGWTPADLLEHLPQNQKLSILCLSSTLLTLMGTIPDHLSLEKINLGL